MATKTTVYDAHKKNAIFSAQAPGIEYMVVPFTCDLTGMPGGYHMLAFADEGGSMSLWYSEMHDYLANAIKQAAEVAADQAISWQEMLDQKDAEEQEQQEQEA